MNLADLAALICETVRKPDADSLAACKNYLKRRDQMLWDGNLWRDSLFTFTQALDPTADWNILSNPIRATSGRVLLPRSFERVLAVRLADQTLPVQNVERYFMDTLDAFAQTGQPVEFTLESPVVYYWDTPVYLYVYGLAATDVAIQVRYFDYTEGKFITVSKNLTSTPQLVGRTTEIEEVTKPASAQIVWLSTSATPFADQFESFAAADTRMEPYQRIRLLPVPTEALTLRALVKKKYSPIATDYEHPRLRQAENVLIAYATGDMLRRSNKYGMANEAYAEGAALLAKLENIEFFQQAQRQQLVPEVAEAYGADNRLYGKGYW